MKLKTWQKWGVMFGMGHIFVLLFYLSLSFFNIKTGYLEVAYYFLAIIEFPVNYIGVKLVPYRFAGTFNDYSLFYFIISGTLFYFIVGLLLGLFVQAVRKLVKEK